MAKKSPSAAKKSKPLKAKTSVKPVKKPVVKALKKLVTKAVKKVAKIVKVSSGKASKSIKPVAVKKVSKLAAKPVEKQAEKKTEKVKAPAVKPALMTKKGKAEPAVIEEAAADIADIVADAVPAKAEKVSKVKPIRIEKGNIDDEKAKWAELFKKLGKDKAINYKMSDTFAALSPVQHKILGWGFILKNDNDRLEVLFETGIRMLISNYKS